MEPGGPKSKREILFYVPNVIGYIRIILLLLAWLFTASPWTFVILYTTSVILDGIDGWAARRFKQTSAFGAWLDVVVDLVGRQLIWNRVWKYGWLLGCMEWLVFVCTHQLGAAWKSSHPDQSISLPSPVAGTMQNGFRSRLGVFTIAGLHALPVWLFIRRHRLLVRLLAPKPVHSVTQARVIPTTGIGEHLWRITEYGVMWILILGRVWCFFIEAWFVWQHVKLLLLSDIPVEYRAESKEKADETDKEEEGAPPQEASDDEDSW